MSPNQHDDAVSTFGSVADYVSFLDSLDFRAGVTICSSFIPSPLFSKDAIRNYFLPFEAVNEDTIASTLWHYRSQFKRALARGQINLVVESVTCDALSRWGRVHEASPEYEVGYAERERVFGLLLQLASLGRLFVVDSPIPYIFRLQPPDGVLIDVQRNTPQQLVQGIWIRESETFEAFSAEVQRLTRSSLSGEQLIQRIDRVIATIRRGKPVDW